MKNLRQENIHSDIFTPRTYQVALLDTALQRNTIVCLGTGTGKTFIAVMLIKELSHEVTQPYEDQGQRTIFLVDTGPLVQQQAKVIRMHSNLSVGEYCGDMSVGQWLTHEWEAEFHKHQVLVMTAQVFVDILHHAFLKLASINLIVFDECHHATKNHPYVQVMKSFDTCPQEHQPRVLGLTASVMSKKIKCPIELDHQLSSLESVLKSTAETSADVTNVDQYGAKPKELVIECEPYIDKSGLVVEISAILETSLAFLQDSNIKFDEGKGEKDPLSIPKTVMFECQNILHTLGPWCASKVAQIFMKQLTKLVEHEGVEMHRLLMNYAFTQLSMIQHIVDDVYDTKVETLEDFLQLMSPKVLRLIQVLRDFKPDDNFVILGGDDFLMDGKSDFPEGEIEVDDDDDDDDDDSLMLSDEEDENLTVAKPLEKRSSRGFGSNYVAVKTPSTDRAGSEEESLCGLVFVERRHTAFALNKLIVELCNWDSDLYFVHSHHITGHAAGSTCSAVKDRELLYKKQEDVLKKFRQRELNLLVSTSVLEEGVDVPRCNLVVRFDSPVDYRSYVQSKGRARASKSKFYMLVNGANLDAFLNDLTTFKGIEQILTSKSQAQGSSNSLGQEEMGMEEAAVPDDLLAPYTPSPVDGAPSVTMNTAISLVNRYKVMNNSIQPYKYCAKLPSDAFTHLTPRCKIETVDEGGQGVLYKASLQLPINSPIKKPIESGLFSTKKLARMAVALKACEVLHLAGELDDHLLPVGKETIKYEDDEKEWEDHETQGHARPGTTKRKQYYQKRIASALLGRSLPFTKCYVYIFSMTLTCPITEEQNTRGRKIHAPDDTPTGFGIVSEKEIPLVPNFPVFTRSGEVTISVELVSTEMTFSEEELETMRHFHRFLFVRVLRLEKDPMVFCPSSADSSYIIVPLIKKAEQLEMNWTFLNKIKDVPLRATKRKYMFKTEEEKFVFNPDEFEDAVVMPSYRNIDQPQYFYVAEMRSDLNPQSPFPSPELYDTFEHYYTSKYGLRITNPKQPLLDVDHTSARLNLLTPRYMNQKGVALPTSSAETRRARRENLQQKQILIPELCEIHPFPASLWRKAVCIPAILYRMNYLLVADEIRIMIATQAKIGNPTLLPNFRFPELEFGFSTKPGEGKVITKDKKGPGSPANGDDQLVVKGDNKQCVKELEKSRMIEEMAEVPHEKEKEGNKACMKVPNEPCIMAREEQQEKQIGCNGLLHDLGKSVTNGYHDSTDSISSSEMVKGKEDIADYGVKASLSSDLDSHQSASGVLDENRMITKPAEHVCNIDTTIATTEPEQAPLTNHTANDSDGEEQFYDARCDVDNGNEAVAKQGISPQTVDALEEEDEEFVSLNPEVNGDVRSEDLVENTAQHLSQKLHCADDISYKLAALTIEDTKAIDAPLVPFHSHSTEDQSVIRQGILAHEDVTADDFPISIRFDEDVDLDVFIGPSPCLILQTLTMSNANDFFNLERLETIGDSFLKFAITVYLYCEYPGIHEGKLSYLRSKQVSNYNLYKLGKKKELPDCMVAVKFEPTENWLPPGYVVNREGAYKGLNVHIASKVKSQTLSSIHSSVTPPCASMNIRDSSKDVPESSEAQNQMQDTSGISRSQQLKFAKELQECTKVEERVHTGAAVASSLMPYNLQTQHSLPDKSIADCVEALIGCYLTTCGQKAALQFMSWLGLKVLPENQGTAPSQCSKPLSWKSYKQRTDSGTQPKHVFSCSVLPAPPSPLLTHVPHAEKVLTHYLCGYNAFEMKINYKFRDQSYLLQAFTHASYHYNTVTDCYQRLEFLGDAILDYVITRHLFEDSKKHSPGILTDLRSALVNNNIFAALAVKWDFHKYFKAISPQLFHVIDKFVTWQKDRNDEINLDEEFEDNDEEEEEEEENSGKEREDIEIPKALGDIFESVAGAIYLDSGMSLDTVWRVYYRMMKPQIDAFTEKIPKSPVRELLEMEPETAKFEKPERTMDGKIRVTVNVVGKGNFRGIGRNYRIAKSAAAKRALKHIKFLHELVVTCRSNLEMIES